MFLPAGIGCVFSLSMENLLIAEYPGDEVSN